MPTVDPNEERTSKYNPTFSILWSWNMIGGYTEMFSDLYKQYLFFKDPYIMYYPSKCLHN